jgi:hypothetical protein
MLQKRKKKNVKDEPRSGSACSTIFLKLAANGLQHVFEKWVERCRKCFACQGRYLEKETVITNFSKGPRKYVRVEESHN